MIIRYKFTTNLKYYHPQLSLSLKVCVNQFTPGHLDCFGWVSAAQWLGISWASTLDHLGIVLVLAADCLCIGWILILRYLLSSQYSFCSRMQQQSLLKLNKWSQPTRDEEGFEWQRTITKLREYNNDILIALWVGPDGKDSDDYIVQVGLIISQLTFLLVFLTQRLSTCLIIRRGWVQIQLVCVFLLFIVSVMGPWMVPSQRCDSIDFLSRWMSSYAAWCEKSLWCTKLVKMLVSMLT